MKAKEELEAKVQKPGEEIQMAQQEFEKRANAEWPQRFKAVQDSWNKLG
mgnify:CR=1 FL=1